MALLFVKRTGNLSEVTGKWSSLSTKLSAHTPNRTPNSSSLGMVICSEARTRWVMCFVNKLGIADGTMTAPEIQTAKQLGGLCIQSKHYSDIIKDVKEGRRNKLACQLTLQLDENHLLRNYGRYDNVNFKSRNQISQILAE